MSVTQAVDKCVNNYDIQVSDAAKTIYREIRGMSEKSFVEEFTQCILHGDGGACLLFGMTKFPCCDMPMIPFSDSQ